MKFLPKVFIIGCALLSVNAAVAQTYDVSPCCAVAYHSTCSGTARPFRFGFGLFPRLMGCRTSYCVNSQPAPVEYAPGIDETFAGRSQERGQVSEVVPDTLEDILDAAEKEAKTALEVQYLDALNAIRKAHGCEPLTNSPSLVSGAQGHAVFMAKYRRLFHPAGVSREIVAYNYSSGINGALSQWLASPAHRAHLLSRNVKFAGCGIFKDRYGVNWCVVRFR